eukprot:TRINITY_DN3193_c0_g1_i1.p1 TRINITY_DN3193_c0_g1~~TRINITY_DN3193_c0_g1_i1.p1  ORF type:complete len:339 (-),score=86.51 TRINITY_DN3193_c0_g1_i1:911-1927(-)
MLNPTLNPSNISQLSSGELNIPIPSLGAISDESNRRKSFLSFLPSHKKIQHPLRQSKSGNNRRKKSDLHFDTTIWERIILEENFRGLTMKEDAITTQPLDVLPPTILLLSPSVSGDEMKMDEGLELLSRIKNLLESKSQMEKEAKLRRTRLAKLETQLIDYQNKLEDFKLKTGLEVFDFQTQIMNLQRKLDFTQEDFEFSRKDLDESKRSLIDSHKKLEEMTSSQQELQKKLTESDGEIDTMKEKIKRDGEVISKLKAKNSRLRKGLDQVSDSLLCIICSENICDAIFWPCKHQTVCEDCSKRSDLKECCLCRSPIIYSLKVYPNFSENGKAKEVGSS